LNLAEGKRSDTRKPWRRIPESKVVKILSGRGAQYMRTGRPEIVGIAWRELPRIAAHADRGKIISIGIVIY